jgi:hypothetical protein
MTKKVGVVKGQKPWLTPDRVKELCARVVAGDKKVALVRELGLFRETLYQYAPVTTGRRALT